MANTSGFKVDVMPQAALADPRLVAFQPDKISDGVLKAFQLADTYNRIKAFQAQQKELAATRDARVGQQNALGQFDIDTLAQKALAANAQSAATLKTAPTLADLTQGNALSQLRLLPGSEALSGATTASALARLPGEEKLALGDIAAKLHGQEVNQSIQPFTDTSTIEGAAGQAAAAHAKAQLVAKEANDRLAKYDEDQKAARDKLVAEIDHIKSQSEQARAMAEYYQGGGTRKNADPIQELGRIQTMVNAGLGKADQILKSQVKNPDDDGKTMIPLSAYAAMIYGGDTPGKSPTSMFGLMGGKSLAKDANAEKMLEELKTIYTVNAKYRSMAESLANEINGVKAQPQPPASAPAVLPQGWSIKK